MQRVLTTGALALLWALPAVTASAVTSYNGDDYSYDWNTRQNLTTCDRESDNTPVKGRVDVDGNQTSDGSVRDGDGNNGVCASAQFVRSPAIIWHHSTCEAPSFRPDTCGNWQATR